MTLTTYPLRLPKSLKAAIEKLSKEEGTSINQFVTLAVAEKVASMKTAEIFAERAKRANPELFRQIMTRPGTPPPAPEDEIPEDLKKLLDNLEKATDRT